MTDLPLILALVVVAVANLVSGVWFITHGDPHR